MNEWTIEDEKKLIYLAEKNLSVEDIHQYFPDIPEGSIAGKLNKLRKQKKLPAGYKFRMTSWDEPTLIDLAKKGLTAVEISERIPGTTTNIIIGRISTLKKEKKLPSDFVLRTGTIRKDPVPERSEKNQSLQKDKSIPVKTLAPAKEVIPVRNTADPAPAPVIRHTDLSLEFNQRISGLEAEATKEKVNENRDLLRKEVENPDNSRYSSEIAELQKRIEQLENRELSALLNKISNMERRLSALEIILSDFKYQATLQKDIWTSVRQSAEINGSSELLKILQDAENIAAKRR